MSAQQMHRGSLPLIPMMCDGVCVQWWRVRREGWKVNNQPASQVEEGASGNMTRSCRLARHDHAWVWSRGGWLTGSEAAKGGGILDVLGVDGPRF